MRPIGFVAAGLLLMAGPAWAQSSASTDAGWPCDVEPKAKLELSDYWKQPVASEAWRSNAEVASLVSDVAPRRVAQDEAVARLSALATRPAAFRGLVAAGLVETIDAERHSIIVGIKRSNARQALLATRIESSYAQLEAPKGAPVEASKAALEEQAEWDTRIFEDRQKMLPVICRQPAVLEARLGALISALKSTPKP